MENAATKRALTAVTDRDFRGFDLDYADSDARVLLNVPLAEKQISAYGRNHAPSRIAEWKREFAGYVQRGDLPALTLLRLGNDHTSGTRSGAPSPRAMVADNDYAVGELVEAVSNSPYWKSTVILIVEDDAQNGFDHVDAHRSTAFVVSPYVQRGLVASRFHNTDSVLRTIEVLLQMPPMCQYDAIAPPLLDVFTPRPDNAESFTAVLPSRTVLAEVNAPSAYRSSDSLRMFPPRVADAGPDAAMTDIVWHAVKGNAKMPSEARSDPE
jgi:hypothetical protein